MWGGNGGSGASQPSPARNLAGHDVFAFLFPAFQRSGGFRQVASLGLANVTLALFALTQRSSRLSPKCHGQLEPQNALPKRKLPYSFACRMLACSIQGVNAAGPFPHWVLRCCWLAHSVESLKPD